MSYLSYFIHYLWLQLFFIEYTKQGTEGFEPISNFDDDRIRVTSSDSNVLR